MSQSDHRMGWAPNAQMIADAMPLKPKPKAAQLERKAITAFLGADAARPKDLPEAPKKAQPFFATGGPVHVSGPGLVKFKEDAGTIVCTGSSWPTLVGESCAVPSGDARNDLPTFTSWPTLPAFDAASPGVVDLYASRAKLMSEAFGGVKSEPNDHWAPNMDEAKTIVAGWYASGAVDALCSTTDPAPAAAPNCHIGTIWTGGACPVLPGDRCELHFKDGDKFITHYPETFDWSSKGRIAGFRIVD